MNVGLFVIFLIGVLCSGYAASRISDALELPETAVWGVSFYLTEWCIISVSLVLLDAFDPVVALSLAAAIPLLLLLGLQGVDRLPFRRVFSGKDVIVLILFLVIMFPIVYQRYEYIEQNGDAGVYSVTAMQLVKNGTLRANLPIRERLSPKKREIFDDNNWLPGAIILPATEKLEFQFYPGWPVMMALWGGIFGLENLHYVMIVLYFLVVFLFYFIIKRLISHRFLPLLITVVFGSSPLLIHFTKYPVSELFLLFLFLFCCYNLLHNNWYFTTIAGLCSTAYFMSHISYFMYLPLFAIMLAMASTWGKENIISFCFIAFIGYLISVPFGLFVSSQYFHEIYRVQFEAFFHQRTARTAVYVLSTFSTVMAVISLFLLIRMKQGRAFIPWKR